MQWLLHANDFMLWLLYLVVVAVVVETQDIEMIQIVVSFFAVVGIKYYTVVGTKYYIVVGIKCFPVVGDKRFIIVGTMYFKFLI